MFEILKNNKKLLAVHIAAAVVVIGVVAVAGIWIGKINHDRISCDAGLQTCQKNLLSADNEKDELASSVESLTDEVNEKEVEIDEVKNTSLYTCLSEQDNISVLPQDLQNSTDTVKVADYIVKNNLYVIACDRLWHGDKNLSGTSTLAYLSYEDRYKNIKVIEAFRRDDENILYITYQPDDLWSPVNRYLTIDKKTDTYTINFIKSIYAYDLEIASLPYVATGSISPDGKYCLLGFEDEIKVIDWVTEKVVKSVKLKKGETADDCVCGWGDECLSGFTSKWSSNNIVDIEIYELPDITKPGFEPDQYQCKQLRKLHIEI